MELALSLCLLVTAFVLLMRLMKPAIRKNWLWLFFCTGVCVFSEYILLTLLPYFRLSFGPIGTPMFIFSFGHLFLLVVELFLINLFRRHPRATLALAIGMQVSLVILAIDGLYFEPFRLTLTRQHVSAPQFIQGRGLRILQISDLHVERITQREQAVIEMARSLQPDLIVLTGDYVNLDYVDDETALSETRNVISALKAPFGVFAIVGSMPVDTPRVMTTVFNGLENIHVLRDEIQTIDFPGGKLSLLGVTLNRGPNQQVLQNLAGQIPPDAYSLLLYHTPDLIETASATGINLYLAGHTHGGQVRLPFYGAIYTSSRYGKQYEMGAYAVGKTFLYVSRGLGTEGFGMPRLRFLCPPELVLFELGKP
jgi:uncharacterized protein